MRRLLLILLVIGILTYRKRQFDTHDRANGYGAFAPIKPNLRPEP